MFELMCFTVYRVQAGRRNRGQTVERSGIVTTSRHILQHEKIKPPGTFPLLKTIQFCLTMKSSAEVLFLSWIVQVSYFFKCKTKVLNTSTYTNYNPDLIDRWQTNGTCSVQQP